MKPEPQVYDLNTRFNFGYYKGILLKDIIEKKVYGHLRNLIILVEPLFIPNPETIGILEKLGLFGRTNDWFKKRCIEKFHLMYKEYSENRDYYISQEKIKKRIEFYEFAEMVQADEELRKEALKIINKEFKNLNAGEDEKDYDTKPIFVGRKPIHPGSSDDPNENPWLRILPEDEAETAYWNTD